jgi:hypothetical protein
MNKPPRNRRNPFFIKLLHWEYWSFTAIYIAILPLWAWLALRAKSFFFFSAANPSIDYGGLMMESKKKIYDLIPPQYYPPTSFFVANTPTAEVLNAIHTAGYTYPLIGKPDIGGKGRGVKKINNEQELIAYAATSPLDYLIQTFVSLEKEVGVFYYRYPNQATGNISGVVRKEMLAVVGDGHSTIEELLLADDRFILQLPTLTKLYGAGLQEVLPAAITKELVPYGNHARGAKFLNDTHLVDKLLVQNIDAICQQITGFYFGRLDVKYNTWEELRQGKNFSIIELNGAGSEPTHVYDPQHSLWFAWTEIIKHWFILLRISKINHQKGVPYLSFKDGLQMLRKNITQEKILNSGYA